MKRLTAVAGGAVFLIALTAALGGSAWGAGGPLSEMARGANPDAVADCGCTTTTPPTSTTTSTSTSSTTSTTSTTLLPPDAPTNSTPSVPAPNTGVPSQVQAASTTPAVSGSAALPFTAATSQPAQLPFTGPDLRPFFLLGLLLVGLGVFLLFGGESGAHSPRRYRHQVRESASGS